MAETKDKKFVTKEQVLFGHKDNKMLPVEIDTIIPVNGLKVETPEYMKIKVIPFKRPELRDFNLATSKLIESFQKKVEEGGIDKETITAQMDIALQDLRIQQERDVVLNRVVEPIFTEEEYGFLPQQVIDAFYLTVMCASKVPKETLLKAIDYEE